MARKCEYGGMLMEYGGKIPQTQIKKGTTHELEHTSNKKKAKKIAMDHFKEHGPTYYTELDKLNLPEYEDGGPLAALKYLDNPMPNGMFGQVAKGLGASVGGMAGGIGGMMSGGGAATAPTANMGQMLNAPQGAVPQGPTQPQILPQAQGGKYNYGGMLMYEDGGNLMGLPEYSFGSWMGDNAGGILQGAGDAVSAIPGIGAIAGPILNMAGKVTDALVGKKRAADALEAKKLKDRADTSKAGFQQQLANNPQESYAAFEMGGDLMNQGFPAPNQAPVINSYDGKSNTHQQGVGGVPVDSRGNPSTVSKQSAVGLTEKGEVTWNGYVFSDKLTT